jgi:integrase
MPVKKYGKKLYQIEFQTPGYARGRFRCSSGTNTMKVAQAYEKHLLTLFHEGCFELLNRVKGGTLSLPRIKQQMDQKGVQGLTRYVEEQDRKAREKAAELRPLLERFLLDRDVRASESLRKDYKTQITWYLEHLEQGAEDSSDTDGAGASVPRGGIIANATHITTKSISKWLHEVETQPSDRYADKRRRQPKTVNHHRAAVSSFCSWLVSAEVIQENPCFNAYRATEVNKDPVYLNRIQWPIAQQAITRYSDDRIARWREDPNEDHERAYPNLLFFDFLVATGATSYNEGCRVRVADIKIDESPGSASVRVWLPGTKTIARARDIWISRELAQRLLRYAKCHSRRYLEPIFAFGKSEVTHVWNGVKALLIQEGHSWIEPVRVYDLRHTFAVNMIVGDRENGIPGTDLPALQLLMGHKRIETTMIYARHKGDHAQEACMMLHRVMGL